MKMISLTCPECGAELETTSDRSLLFCEYCGRKILIEHNESEHQKGYDYERGRMKAQAEGYIDQDLLDSVESLIEPVEEIEKLEVKKKTITSSSNELKTQYLKWTSDRAKPYALIGSVLAFFVFVGLLSGLNMVFAVIISGIMAFSLNLLLNSLIESKKKDVSARLLATEKSLNEVNDQIDSLSERCNFGPIPEPYRDSEALKYMHKMLTSGRAVNLRQAQLLYDDYLEKCEEKEQQQKQFEYQQRQIDELKRMNQELSKTGKRKSTADSVVTAGSVIAAGITIAKVLNGKKK